MRKPGLRKTKLDDMVVKPELPGLDKPRIGMRILWSELTSSKCSIPRGCSRCNVPLSNFSQFYSALYHQVSALLLVDVLQVENQGQNPACDLCA